MSFFYFLVLRKNVPTVQSNQNVFYQFAETVRFASFFLTFVGMFGCQNSLTPSIGSQTLRASSERRIGSERKGTRLHNCDRIGVADAASRTTSADNRAVRQVLRLLVGRCSVKDDARLKKEPKEKKNTKIEPEELEENE